MISVKKIHWVTLLLLIGGGLYYFVFQHLQEDPAYTGTGTENSALPAAPLPSDSGQEEKNSDTQKQNSPLPKEILLKVPFTPQAPTGNWDELHNEACEEASVLMANAFFAGDTRSTLSPNEAEKEIEKLTQWQQENLGYYLSIDSEEVARMTKEVYGLKAEVLREFSEDTLKKALSENKLVLVPVNGRLLGNPYFKQPGPIYHMFVIKGYNKDTFIVNEPGTKRGKDYQYSYQTIRGAIGDYDHSKKETVSSRPAIVIVSK